MSANSTSNTRIAKNTFFLYIRMFLVLIVSLFTTRIVLQALGVVDYGINNVVAGFVSMFAFLNTSMSNGIQRFYNFQMGRNDTESMAKVYNAALQIQTLIALILLILLETFGLWYINYQMVIPADRLNAALWIFQFSVLSLIIIVIQVPYSAAIMAHEKMQFYSYISIVEVIAKLSIAYLLLVVNCDKLFIYGLLQFVITLIVFTINVSYAKLNFKELKFKLSWDLNYLKPMLSFSGWNILDMFAYMLKGQGTNVLLNAFFGPIVNAARGISTQIMGAIQSFSHNIIIAFKPQLVECYAQHNYNRVCHLMYSMSKISYILLFIITIPIAIEIDFILHIWLGETVPEYTVPFTLLVLADMLISSLNTPLSQVVQATGVLRRYQTIRSLIVAAIIPISWIALKLNAPPISVFWIAIILTIINQPVSMILLHNVFPYKYSEYIKEVIWPCIYISIIIPVIPIIIHNLMTTSLLRLGLVFISTIIIAALICYFMAFNQSEKNIIASFTSKIKK